MKEVKNKGVKSGVAFGHDWSERQYFIHACFEEDLQKFYSEWVGQRSGRMQLFDVSSEGMLVHKYWNPSNICCESGELLTREDMDVKIGYWHPHVWKPIRKDLKAQAMAKEALDCQSIDCSCNDCKFFDRGGSMCKKFGRATVATVNTCHPQNQDCFEHRRLV